MKKILTLVVMVVLLISIVACGGSKEDAPKFSITFNSNGGSEVPSFVVEGEKAGVQLPSPTKEGYTFMGWYTDESLNTKWDGSIRTDLNLYASWKVNTYKITYVTNGADEIEEATFDFSEELPDLPTPLKKGYTFVGWCTDSALTNIFTDTLMPAKDLTLYAKWAVNQYTVKFNVENVTVSEDKVDFNKTVNKPVDPVKKGWSFIGWELDGERFDFATPITDNIELNAKFMVNTYNLILNIDGDKTTMPFTYGTSLTDAITSPTKDGKIFAGWQIYDKETNQYVAYTFLNKTMPDYDFEVVATWTALEYSINFFLNGGEGTTSLSNIKFESENFLPANPVKEGYVFNGWYEDSQLTVKFTSKTMPAKDLNLYADWKAIDYNVIFVANGGLGSMSSQSFSFGIPQKLANVEYTRKGYTFKGWATVRNGEVVYDNMEEVTNLTTKANGSVSLYAIWEINQYTLTFENDGVETVIRGEYNSSVSVPKNPTKEGYTFKGWDQTVPSKMPDCDMRFVAIWEINQYTITFVVEGKEYKVTGDYQSVLDIPVEPNKVGYTFMGWDEEVPARIPGKDMTYTAVFTINQYTITYDTDGGSIVQSVTGNYNSHVYRPNTPTKTGYTFMGWDKETPSTMPAENLTIKALWKINQYTLTFVVDGMEYKVKGDYNTTFIVPVTPKKEGYTFVKWNKDIPSTIPAEDMTIIARFEINTYKLTYVYDDLTQKVVELEYGQEFDLTITDKEGYTFDGWYTDKANTQSLSLTTMPASDMVIYAKWTVNKYTMTFILEGNTYTVKADYKTKLVIPVNPVKEGYTFSGWDKVVPETIPATDMTFSGSFSINSYLFTVVYNNGMPNKSYSVTYGGGVEVEEDPNYQGFSFDYWSYNGEVFDFATFKMPANDVTVIAIYENLYTITFDTDGGTPILPIVGIEGTRFDKPADPVKEGYTFSGWSTPIPSTIPGENLTIKALWSINQYKVTFVVDGKKYIVEGDYNAKFTIPVGPSKEGYTFTGWDKEFDTRIPSMDMVITATFKANTYYVSYKANTTLYTGVMLDQTCTYDYEFNLATNKFSKVGYTFLGWSTTPDGEVLYTNNQLVKSLTTIDLETVNLYAVWEANTYEITLNNEGSLTTFNAIYDEVVELPTLSKEGYTFKGWSFNSTIYKDSVSNITNKNNDKVELVAVFTINQYTIVFMIDGNEYELTLDYNEKVNIPITPYKEGYNFIGWDKEVPEFMPAKNQVIIADFVIGSYTITFESNGGEELEPITGIYNSYINVPENPNKLGYTFKGWYSDKELTTAYKFTTIPSKDITVYAKWVPHAYRVVFYGNGATGMMDSMAFTYDETRTLITNKFTKEGYTFAGWSLVVNGEVKYLDGEEASNLTATLDTVALYAVWTPNTYYVKFHGNGATGGMMENQLHTYDTGLNLTSNGYVKTGYRFLGWATSENGSVVYNNNKNVINLTTGNGYVVNLYAVWAINQYTLSFMVNGGSLVDNITKYYNEEITIPQNPTKAGHTFAGWYREADFSGEEYIIGDKMPAESIILYAKWDINFYEVKFNLPETHGYIAQTLTLSVPYNTNLSDYLIANKYPLSRVGHDINISDATGDVTHVFETFLVTSDMSFDVKYHVKSYNVRFIIDGNIFYTAYLEYGSKITFADVLAEIQKVAVILHELNLIVEEFNNGKTPTDKLKKFDESYREIILSVNNSAMVSLYKELVDGNADMGELSALAQLVSNVYHSYETHGKTYPMKENYIFTEWVLGSTTYYLDQNPGDAYLGYAPAGDDGNSNIVANFVEAKGLDLSKENYNSDTRTLNWENKWNKYVQDYLVKYYGYSQETKNRFTVSFDIGNYNSAKDVLYIIDSTTKLNYEFMKNGSFSLPGYYDIVVVANIIVKSENGDVIADFTTKIGSSIAVTLTPDMENADLTASGEYFYIFDENGVKYIYLFTNTQYNFNNYIEVTEVINDNGSASDHVKVSYGANNTTTLNTTGVAGDFLLRSYSDATNYTEYYAQVFPTVTKFSLSESLSQFKFTTQNADSSEFLNDSSEDTYKIGNRIEGFTATDYLNNGVKLDVVVLTNGGISVDTHLYEEYLSYDFYIYEDSKWNQITGVKLEKFARYNEEEDTWEFDGELGIKYKVVIAIDEYRLPKAIKEVIKPIELVFELNDCINIYTHEKLQSIFANLNYRNGINIHSDIEAYLTDAERYTDALKTNPAIQLIQTITYADHKKGSDPHKLDYTKYSKGHIPYSEYWLKRDDILFDGSPLNLTTWEQHHLIVRAYIVYKEKIAKKEATIEDYYDYIATFRTGNVYFRSAIVDKDYEENYQIYGNYFEIDGSKLPYMTVNSVSNLSNVEGYLVPNCYSSIFTYNISVNTMENTTIKFAYEDAYSERYIGNNAVLNFNDLMITGNTSTTHHAGDDLTNSAIALMNRNAGGYSGITTNFGGSVSVNNTVVRGATLGIASRYEGRITLDYTYLISNWANSIYCLDAGDVEITNSYIKDSGGSAIYVEDGESNNKNTLDDAGNFTVTKHYVKMDINTKVENYISGTEGYFNAYGMTANVVFLKGQLEPNLNRMGYKSLIQVYNYLGLKTEMLNFVYMSCPTGPNKDYNKDAAVSGIRFIMTDSTGRTIQHSSYLNPANNDSKKMQLAYLAEDSINYGYCLLSYAIPTKGNAVLGLAIDQYNG